MKRKRLELPNELTRDIWSFVDVNTRVENKILPFKLKHNFTFIKPKIIHKKNFVVQIFSFQYISFNLQTKETIIVSVKNDNIFFYIFDENYNHL